MTSPQAMLNFIAVRDLRLMRHVNRWQPPRWIRLWMICATRGGDGWLWYLMGLVILLFGRSDRFLSIGSSFMAAGAGILVFLQLKRVTGRKRPCSIEPSCWARLLPPDQFSFPSGHTITAFAVTLPMMHFYPDLTAGLLFCACSIAISRVLLGLHFLSDVVAGAGIGMLLGFASYSMLG